VAPGQNRTADTLILGREETAHAAFRISSQQCGRSTKSRVNSKCLRDSAPSIPVDRVGAVSHSAAYIAGRACLEAGGNESNIGRMGPGSWHVPCVSYSGAP
jgi:hypothetical protein